MRKISSLYFLEYCTTIYFLRSFVFSWKHFLLDWCRCVLQTSDRKSHDTYAHIYNKIHKNRMNLSILVNLCRLRSQILSILVNLWRLKITVTDALGLKRVIKSVEEEEGFLTDSPGGMWWWGYVWTPGVHTGTKLCPGPGSSAYCSGIGTRPLQRAWTSRPLSEEVCLYP